MSIIAVLVISILAGLALGATVYFAIRKRGIS